MTEDSLMHPEETTDSHKVNDLIERFFGEGNDAGDYENLVQPFIDLLHRRTDAPVVLPRYVESRDAFAVYVISRNSARVSQVRELIQAFAGPTYCVKGDTVPANLDPNDPVEAAVIDFAGTESTFIVEAGTNRQHRAKLREALGLMQKTAAAGPQRDWYVPKPLGRLLAEFQGALATGGEAVSQAVLDEITARGGVTATNIAHLRVKRLDRLGLSRDLLAMNGLPNVLRQDPPLPVKQAVLNAIHSVFLCEPLDRGEFEAALDALRDAALPYPLPLHEDVRPYDDEAVTVLVTAAIGRKDLPAVNEMVSTLIDTGRVGALPEAVKKESERLLGHSTLFAFSSEKAEKNAAKWPVPSETGGGSITAVPPESWCDLFTLIARKDPVGLTAIHEEAWRNWPSPAESDEEGRRLLDGLDDASWKNIWETTSGPFIDAVGYEKPAPLTALSFITYALSFDRLGPGDLLALQALTEIFLRSSPGPRDYRDLLEMVQESCDQWVSPENAVTALDFADRLVLAACPSPAVRMNLAMALLEPLHRFQGRLERPVHRFAHQLSDELEIPFKWNLQEELQETDDPFSGLPSSVSLLLYSLDEAVLHRTEDKLQNLFPGLRVTLSHDKVGSDSLRQKSRNADLVVLATRCAKHAATGFITENAKHARMAYANGSGSASLLRAAVNGLSQLAEESQTV
ncbi:hypothetical protein MRI28_16270 [Nocardiopsis dassonvillei]|uniref:protein DpdD n=1 Tax=Nocardiopsis dassonvillei TaxID=2014 RepID=UPI00200C0CA7|nr:protein DpdD [Nocardiopsis dassonvillei]MCK9871174.1 hypothetical protein [Nocardiopsis dassonvillei]